MEEIRKGVGAVGILAAYSGDLWSPLRVGSLIAQYLPDYAKDAVLILGLEVDESKLGQRPRLPAIFFTRVKEGLRRLSHLHRILILFENRSDPIVRWGSSAGFKRDKLHQLVYHLNVRRAA